MYLWVFQQINLRVLPTEKETVYILSVILMATGKTIRSVFSLKAIRARGQMTEELMSFYAEIVSQFDTLSKINV